MSERPVKSAERTLALFELFAECQSGLTIGHIANGLRAPQPSISFLVKNLVKLGYLEHDPVSRTYLPSIRVLLLGGWIERKLKDNQSLVKCLDAVQRCVDETSYIGIQNGIYAQHVIVQKSARPNRLRMFSGRDVHLTQCASGRALLALKKDSEISALIRRCNSEIDDERFRVSRIDALRMASEVRKKGYAKTSNASARIQGVGGLAMTFYLPGSSTALAVGVGASIENLERKQGVILESLRKFKESFAA